MALQGGSLALANEWNSFGNDYDSYRIHSDTFRSRLRDIQTALELCQEPPEFIWKHFKHSQRLLKCFRSHSNAFGGYADHADPIHVCSESSLAAIKALRHLQLIVE